MTKEKKTVLVLDRRSEEVVVSIKGKQHTYELRELDGAARDAFLSDYQKRMKFEDGKPVGLSDFDNHMAYLVSLSLYDGTEEDAKQVPLEVIQSWPGRVQKILFEKASELSLLDENTEIATKN